MQKTVFRLFLSLIYSFTIYNTVYSQPDSLCKNPFTYPSSDININETVKQKTDFSMVNDTLFRALIVARSFYQELDSLTVHVRYKKMRKATMQAQPSFSIFKGKETREYIIFLNQNVKDNGFVYSEIPYNVLVGWFGHELAHIYDYKDRSNLALIIFGIRYVCSHKFKNSTEYSTDSITIAHNLGCPLLEKAVFCLNNPNVNQKYKKILWRFYMKPEEIAILIGKNSN